MRDSNPEHDWFDSDRTPSGQPGLAFACSCCGNCCTGPTGFVLFTDAEAQKLADRLELSLEDFMATYTRDTSEGRSLTETHTAYGYDCVFLDRTTIPGKAICGVYEDRPTQCKTWPFWPSVVKNPRTWQRSARGCPGMDSGTLIPPEQIRILRDQCDI